MSARWTAVVPVKPWDLAKTRLDLPIGLRAAIAKSMAIDTLRTVGVSTLVDRMLLVSSRSEVCSLAGDFGAVAVSDRGLGSADPLNDALEKARAWARLYRPDAPIVVVPADLPALSVEVFDAALCELSGALRAFVPDADGEGTTLYAARRPDDLRVGYGPRSAARHIEQGAVPVVDVDPRIRRDLDTVHDLRVAVGLGLAPATAAILQSHGLPIPVPVP